MTIQEPITLQEAKSIARHFGLTLRKVRSGHYRVNFRDGREHALYAVDLEDAVNAAVEMARKRAAHRANLHSGFSCFRRSKNLPLTVLPTGSDARKTHSQRLRGRIPNCALREPYGAFHC